MYGLAFLCGESGYLKGEKKAKAIFSTVTEKNIKGENSLMKRNKKRRYAITALVLTVVMMSSLMPLAVFAAGLDAPVITTANATGVNGHRTVTWEEVQGAESYTIYLYQTKSDAEADTNVAAQTVVGNVLSMNLKEVTNWTGRLLRDPADQAAFEAISDYERTGNANPDTTAVASKSNIRPGTYWARVKATSAGGDSELSNVGETPLPIPMGPWEGARLIANFVAEYGVEALTDPANHIPDYKPDDPRELRLVDLRPAFELNRGGYIRYIEQWLEGIHQTPGQSGTTDLPYSGPAIITGNPGFMSDEQILEALPNKNATILTL